MNPLNKVMTKNSSSLLLDSLSPQCHPTGRNGNITFQSVSLYIVKF